MALAHDSVKGYFTSDRIWKGPAKKYGLQESASDIVIANACIGHLLQFHDAESFCDETVATHRLARHAAKFWTDHTRSYASEEGSTQELVMKLFAVENGAYLNWIRIHDLDRPWKGSDPGRQAADIVSPLYYASLVGLTDIVRCLLRDGSADVHAQGGFYGNVLEAALISGNEQVVKLLFDKVADANTQGRNYGSALQVASYRGYKEVVRLLLDEGAGVNGQGGLFGNAFQAASADVNEQVVRLLLDKGADVNAQSEPYGDALQAALHSGYVDLLRALHLGRRYWRCLFVHSLE